MSEVLLDIAEPLLKEFSLPEDRDAFVAAVKIASVLWNEAAYPAAGGREKLLARLNDVVGEPCDPETERLFDAVIRRARVRYPNLDRLITSVEVTVDDEGACSVKVISAV